MTGRIRAAVIADDLTGANATGALLHAAGLRTLALLEHERLDDFLAPDAAGTQGFEALTIDAGTRAATAATASARVRDLAAQLRRAGVTLIGKRIDSTLRGHIGAEIDALLDGADAGSLALVVAAVPALGRVTAGGYLLVNGRPLLETVATADPWLAPRSSLVAEVIGVQSRARLGCLSLGDLAGSVETVRRRLIELAAAGSRVVVADATTEAHIALLAAAAAPLPLLPVDPGPFCAELARARLLPPTSAPTLLAIAGSVTPQTRVQLAELLALPNTALVALDARALCSAEREAEVERGVRTLAAASASLLVLTAAPDRAAVLDLAALSGETGLEVEAAAWRIAEGLAEVAARVLVGPRRVAGVYTTGGAVTRAVVRRLGATSIAIERAVLPLAVLGRLRDGPRAGLPLVSKGGLVGDERAAVACIEALRSCAAE